MIPTREDKENAVFNSCQLVFQLGPGCGRGRAVCHDERFISGADRGKAGDIADAGNLSVSARLATTQKNILD